MKASTTVPNTSKNPSTRRWTTHHQPDEHSRDQQELPEQALEGKPGSGQGTEDHDHHRDEQADRLAGPVGPVAKERRVICLQRGNGLRKGSRENKRLQVLLGESRGAASPPPRRML